VFKLKDKNLYIGGHSKGGNLALIAGMYANRLVRHKITKIYSADGPGLLDKEYKSLRYQNTKKKFVHIIPDCSIVGILLNHSGDKVVKATRRGIIAHNIRYWEIEENHFKKSTLKDLSKEIDKRLMQWIRKTSIEDKREVVDDLYNILLEANVKSFIELKENKTKILDIIKKSNIKNNKTKEKIKELLYILIKSIEATTKDEIKENINNFFKLRINNGTK
jgi:hypothetical protein